MASVAVLKMSLISHRNNAMAALDRRYSARINKLLEQKRQIFECVQRQFDEQMEEIQRAEITQIVDASRQTQPSLENGICEHDLNRPPSLPPRVSRDVRETEWQCLDCSYTTKHRRYLIRHSRMHSAQGDIVVGKTAASLISKPLDKKWKCDHCRYETKHKHTLTKHIRTHTSEKPFGCRHCGKRFPEKCTLERHIRTHTGEKPYECEHCGKAFADKSNFTRHTRIHTGEKPYACSRCNKRFARSCGRNRHVAICGGLIK